MMKWLLFIVAFIFIVILIIAFSKLTFVISYKHVEDDDHLTIDIRALLGLITYRVDVPYIRVADNSPAIITKEKVHKKGSSSMQKGHHSMEDLFRTMDDVKNIAIQVVKLHKIVKAFLKRVHMKKFNWFTEVGTGDAASTGVLVGVLWSIKGGILTVLSNYLLMQRPPQMAIYPDFHRLASKTEITCMLQFRIGYAMLAGIKFIKGWKGGSTPFKTKPFTMSNNHNEKTIN